MDTDPKSDPELRISEWRTYFQKHHGVRAPTVNKLEDHLRDELNTLYKAGLSTDEAFLVAVQRIGTSDDMSLKIAHEYLAKLSNQVVATYNMKTSARSEFLVVIGLALTAALTIKIPEAFNFKLLGDDEGFYLRNFSFFMLPPLTIYFSWKRHLKFTWLLLLATCCILTVLLANIYPFTPSGDTERLTALHLPIVLWLIVGFAYVRGEWNSYARRMDFIRFSGELFIYYVLIALGGGVFTMFTLFMFTAIGLGHYIEWVASSWILPCGAVSAVIIGAWLVETKQNVAENIAPVLTLIFTPLFTIVLLAFLVTLAWPGNGIDVDREILIGLDLLLILILGLLLYYVSARDPKSPPNPYDALQLALILSALVIDMLGLVAISGRIFEFGFSANKIAALGENFILLINLTWSAWLYLRFLRRKASFTPLEHWQTAYLPVYSVWASVVVVIFPPTFGFL